MGGGRGTEELRALAIKQISVFMSIKRNVSRFHPYRK